MIRKIGNRLFTGLTLRASIHTIIYYYKYYYILLLRFSSQAGQEGEDHARREVFPLLTPLSLGFVTASGV